jgi:hypothetical protein
MQFTILDSRGNVVASYDDDLTARAVFHAIVAVEPEAADHLALLTYDDEGMPVGEARTIVDVAPPVEVEPSPYVLALETWTAVREPLSARTQYVETRIEAWSPVPA